MVRLNKAKPPIPVGGVNDFLIRDVEVGRIETNDAESMSAFRPANFESLAYNSDRLSLAPVSFAAAELSGAAPDPATFS